MNEKQTAEKSDEVIDWTAELERHGRWLRTVIAARCREPQAVDEIMQEVSIAVIKQSAPDRTTPLLRDASKIAPWLYQVAVRQSLMYRRKHGRRRNHERRFAEQIESQPRTPSEPNPLDWLIATERRELVRKGIDQLNPRDAEILMLKYTEDWTYQQIAKHLDTTESAIESRLHRARKKMRSVMSSLQVVDVKS